MGDAIRAGPGSQYGRKEAVSEMTSLFDSWIIVESI
jgi:hypothetical protein